MADSIYRIMPATVTPDRLSVTRRERDGKERRDGQPRERETANSSAQPAADAQPEAQTKAENSKGNRLDVSA